MNGNDFLNAMTDVDDKHIISAEKKNSKRRGLLIEAISVAAVAVIAVTAIGINLRFRENSSNQSETTSAVNSNTDGSLNNYTPRNDIVFPKAETSPTLIGELPKISPKYQCSSGWGIESYDDVKPDNGNPWNYETDFETLPVYRSVPLNSDHDFIMETLKCVVDTLGYDFSKMTIIDNFITKEKEQLIRERYNGYGAREEEVERMIVINKLIGSEISARYDYDFITFMVSINLRYEVEIRWFNRTPNGSTIDCGFTLPDAVRPESNTPSEMEAAGKYMLETFINMFGIENPKVDNTPGNFDYVKLYESGTDTEELVNYQMNHTEFWFNDSGNIFLIKFCVPGGMDKVGDYPIISVDEAKKRLYNNIYTTKWERDYKFIGTEQISGVDLVYLTHSFGEYDMPYYCFFTEDIDESGKTVYKKFYVPAITNEYLLLD